ncbi:OprD family outer membrane porin [Terrimonas alba]|uniref:OprD family outer membrane porin n=1 Tax=Terrimonas alba TaxID=3349636 RepID=UPI0035F3FB20
MKLSFLLSACFVFIASTVNAQTEYLPNTENKPSSVGHLEDSTSLLYAFKKGSIHGHLRNFFMATDNSKGLTDYYANATGGGIKYETASYKGFQLGLSGFFVFNMASSNLAKPDVKTNQLNRYEIGLFDIEDPKNKTDIDRLEELYLKYSRKNSQIVFGKQLLNTPFINLQDGRMRPTEVGGIWAEINKQGQTQIEAGFLYEMSPRSTVKWYGIGRSVGIYPAGINPDGTKSGYAGSIESKGVAMVGITHQALRGLTIKAWELFTENVFNTAMLQADLQHDLYNGGKLVASIQFIRQDAVKNGGNEDPVKTYFPKDNKARTFGARIGWENSFWDASLNYNRITKDGRYLLPREWGREPFYTFLPRERNEGFGDVHAYMARLGYTLSKARVKAQAGFGYYDLPAPENFRLNKYGMPSYTQLNIDLRYQFNGLLKGLESQLLFVHKGRAGNLPDDPRHIINKVNMNLWNLIFNYHF